MKKVLIVVLSIGITLSASYYVYLKQKNIKIEEKIDSMSNEIDVLAKEKTKNN